MHKEGISIVVVSWNTKSITDNCLFLLKKAIDYVEKRANVEVVVVDNYSSDGTGEMIKKKHPWVRLINSNSNLGYAKGNNLGFSKTNPKNKYLLLLNSDVFIGEDTLGKALDYFAKNPECNVLGCRLLSPSGTLQPSAGYLPTPINVWTWIWGVDLLPVVGGLFRQFHPKKKSYFDVDKEVGWVQGAFLFMNREVFERTTGFDENFFMYMDEVEWCKRASLLGYKIFYTTNFFVTHLDKASAHGDIVKLSQTYSLEVVGVIYYLRKYYTGKLDFLIFLIKIGVSFRLLLFSIIGNKVRTKAYKKILAEI